MKLQRIRLLERSITDLACLYNIYINSLCSTSHLQGSYWLDQGIVKVVGRFRLGHDTETKGLR